MYVEIEDLLKNINEDSILDQLKYDLLNYCEAYDLSDDRDFFRVDYSLYEWNDFKEINPNYELYMNYKNHNDYGLLFFDKYNRNNLCRDLDSMSIPYILGESEEEYFIDSICQDVEVTGYWIIIDKLVLWLCGKLDMLGMICYGFKNWDYAPFKDDECHLEYNVDFLSNIINGDWEDYFDSESLFKCITKANWNTINELFNLNCGYLAKFNESFCEKL